MKKIEGYTKGPWRWGAEDSCSCGGTPLEGDGSDPVLVIYESHGGGAMPNPANAELIASAPETYERCVALESMLKEMIDLVEHRWGYPNDASSRQDIVGRAEKLLEEK